MSNPIYVEFTGDFGNKLFHYATARAVAEARGVSLNCQDWQGDQLFDLPPHSIKKEDCDIFYANWNSQEAVRYTRSDARRWFKFKDSVLELLKPVPIPVYAAHYRLGSYKDGHLPIVSRSSHTKAFQHFYPNGGNLEFICEESPCLVPGLLPFAGDFYRMINAKVLFRANSTFSRWAGILSIGRVFSPLMEGVPGYGERECGFVEGNHPRHCDHNGWDDIHIKE